MNAKVRDSQIDLERKLEALGESEQRLQTVIENLSEGLVVSDMDGQLMNWNRAALEFHGFASLDEALLKLTEFINIFELSDLNGVVLPFDQWPLPRIIRGERLRNLELGIRRLDSDWSRIFNYGGSLVREANGQFVAVVTISDITERKLSEEELLRTNQSLKTALAELQIKTLELASMTQQFWQSSKLATMGELAASVAHELNNPLATVALHTEDLLGQLAANDPRRRSLTVIEEEVDRMAALVGNLLVFSRRSHRELSTVDLRQELRDSLGFIRYHLRSHRVDVLEDFAGPLPTVQADRQQLRQVFLNLITNASDAMPTGGTLTVTARVGKIPGGAPGVVIEFVDTGTGVATGDLPKLWEPFFTTKPEGKGTGLGLSICRRTIEEHRGTIEIKTGPGKGATVRIILPATDERIEVAA